MDYQKAAAAHLGWIANLRDELERGIPKNPDAVGREDLCELGRWLYGEGRRYCNLEGYDTVNALHHAFHKSAAYSAELAEAGRLQEALDRLAPGGACESLSGDLLASFTQFFGRLPTPSEPPALPRGRTPSRRAA